MSACLDAHSYRRIYIPRMGRVGMSPNMFPGDCAESMSETKDAGEVMTTTSRRKEERKRERELKGSFLPADIGSYAVVLRHAHRGMNLKRDQESGKKKESCVAMVRRDEKKKRKLTT